MINKNFVGKINNFTITFFKRKNLLQFYDYSLKI